MTTEVAIAVGVIGIVTYLIRISFLVSADRFSRLSPLAETMLRQIPPAVLAALVVPSVLQPGGEWSAASPELWAAIGAALVAWRWRSATASLLVGMTLVIVLTELP